MKIVLVGVLGSLALGLLGCGGTTATSDAQTQSQAQSTAADASASGKHTPKHHHGPPAAAFAACESKAEGDTCTVAFGNDSLAGKCVAPPADAPDARIVCRPDSLPDGRGPGGPGGRPHGPPPAEIFAACEGKARGAAYSVTLGDRTIEGTCKAPPPGVDETRLGCAPSRPHPHTHQQ